MLRFLTVFSFIFFSSFKLFASETTGVVSTIQPINSLVNAVIGDTGKTILLIPTEASPHDYKLKPSDTKILQNANIIFFVSEHLEASVTKIFENLPKNIKTINLMEDTGIQHLAIRDNEAWERHDHIMDIVITMVTMIMINILRNMTITTITNMQKNMTIMTIMKKKMTFTFG